MLLRGDPVEAHVRAALMLVVLAPRLDQAGGMAQIGEQVFIEEPYN